MIKAICSNSSHSIILLRNKETYEMFSAKIFPYKNKDTLASIVREIEILTQLNHPSFLKYIGFSPFDFNNDDCPIIITEYYKNNKLSNIRQKITEWNDTKKLINLYGIACGMKYLHSLNIIHRNLNTSNILLDENFYPKIAGFGSSRMNTYDEGFLSSALYPEFIAPEFFTQKETFNDKALDVYSYAMIAYIIMTEQSPFSAKNNYRIIDQVTRGERPSFNKSIPKIYQTLIENCWDNVSVSRPSFEEIISFIEGNLDQFITENVDKNEFLKYVDYANKKNISVNIKTDTSQRYKRNIPVLSADLKFKVDLEKYSKQSKIGEGSFGRVYKVLENETGNIYACKISKNEMSEITQNEMDEISQREMDNIIDNVINLIREINILSKLNHYCIMKFIGYSLVDFKNNPKPTIITEFFSNGSLDEVIKQERIFCSLPGWDDTKKLINIYGIASGMKYLHSLNILHRDLRPGNILVDENLCPKLADFGLSKEINTDDTNEITFSGIKGTPMYIAPEIWRNCDYRKAGDVYAFAFIVYEIITNEIPYNNYAYFQVMKDIMDGKRPDIHSSVDECYKNLIEKCWANDPKDRLTFEKIVHELKEDKHFIKDTIDSNDFFEYVYFVDQYFADIKSENKKITQLKGKSFQKVDLRDKKIIESKSEKIKEEDLIKVEEIEVEKYGFIELKNYKKQSLIFESDFSKFYKIIDRKSKQIYSAKESKISMKEFSKNDILKLTREVNILSQLNHPSITKFIGYSPVNFKNRPKPTIITEYLLNGSLNQILEKERNNCQIEGWNDTKKLIIIYGVASSMMYLHSHNILHRDLRPSNILLDEYLCPKLSDFGLCTKYHDANTMSFQSTSGIKGQPSYLSPEILSSCKYSKASDVYAFALVVYEIVTNEIPFNGLNFSQIVIEVVTKSTRPQFNKQINESYRNLIEKCWQKDPEDRPSFERIVNELKKNSSFITNSINKDDFNKYIKYIDDYYTTFESSNKVLDFDDFIERNNETFIKVSLNKVENGDNKNRKKHHHRKNQHENDDDN